MTQTAMLVTDYLYRMAFGEDFYREIHLLNPDRSPVNLGGYTARMTIHRSDFQYDVNTAIIDASNGKISLTIPHTDSGTLFPKCPPNCSFNVEIISAGGQVTSVLSGDFISEMVSP